MAKTFSRRGAMPFEKSGKDKEMKGMKEYSSKEEKYDGKQSRGTKKPAARGRGC